MGAALQEVVGVGIYGRTGVFARSGMVQGFLRGGTGAIKGEGRSPPPQWSYSLSATASSQLPWKSSMRPWSTRWASSGSMGILASKGTP